MAISLDSADIEHFHRLQKVLHKFEGTNIEQDFFPVYVYTLKKIERIKPNNNYDDLWLEGQGKRQANLFCKGLDSKYLDFVGETVNVADTEFCRDSLEATTNNTEVNGHDSVPIKHYIQKQVED